MQLRIALVTDGGSGIGAGIAKALAGHGYQVAALEQVDDAARAVVDQVRDTGWSALAVCADVGDPAGADRAVDEVTAALGPASILVNNAGFAQDIVSGGPHG